MRKWIIAAAAIAAMPSIASAQDAEAGKTVFNKCKACHVLGKNSVGPNLVGVVGSKAGEHAAGYNYSKALKESGLTWDDANLTEWLKNPKAKVPGNKMVFVGLKADADIANVIAYLKVAK